MRQFAATRERDPSSRTQRLQPLWLALLLMAALGLLGCANVNDHLTIHADGSGKIEMEVTADPGMGGMGMAGQAENLDPGLAYPPTDPEAARLLFPEDAFELTTEQAFEEGQSVLRVTATFESIEQLLASPYAQVHALVLERDPQADTLTLRARTGADLAAALQTADLKDAEMEGPVAPQQLDKARQDLLVQFKVTLPNEVTAPEATATEGATATWRISAQDLGVGQPTADALRRTLIATSSAQGVTFTPESPRRLIYHTFDEVEEGVVREQEQQVDVAAVKEAVKVVPVELSVVRTIDLAGEAWMSEDGTSLTAAVVLPKRLEPQKVTNFKLLEATTGAGKSLLDQGDEMEQRMSRHHYGGEQQGYVDDEFFKMVRARMGLPEWGQTTIQTIRGQVDLVYPGGAYRAKAAEAVTADMIGEGQEAMFNMDGGQPVASKQLQAQGIELTVSSAARQAGLLTIQVGLGEDQSVTIDQAQVYDAKGRPWRTFVMQEGPFGGMGEGRQVSLLVAGDPEPPLSLVLEYQAAGATISAPFELHDVDLAGDPQAGEENAPADE